MLELVFHFLLPGNAPIMSNVFNLLSAPFSRLARGALAPGAFAPAGLPSGHCEHAHRRCFRGRLATPAPDARASECGTGGLGYLGIFDSGPQTSWDFWFLPQISWDFCSERPRASAPLTSWKSGLMLADSAYACRVAAAWLVQFLELALTLAGAAQACGLAAAWRVLRHGYERHPRQTQILTSGLMLADAAQTCALAAAWLVQFLGLPFTLADAAQACGLTAD